MQKLNARGGKFYPIFSSFLVFCFQNNGSVLRPGIKGTVIIEYQDFGKAYKPVVVLLKPSCTPIRLPEQLLWKYHFIVPEIEGEARDADEIAGFVKRKYGGHVEALCCTSESWELMRGLEKRQIHAEQVIAETDPRNPGKLIGCLLSEFQAMRQPGEAVGGK